MGWVKNKDFDITYYQYDDSKAENDEIIEIIYEKNKAMLLYRHGNEFNLKENRANTHIINWNSDTPFTSLNSILDLFKSKKCTVIINDFYIYDEVIEFNFEFSGINFTNNFTMKKISFKQDITFWYNRFLGSFDLSLNIIEGQLFFYGNSFTEAFYFIGNKINHLMLNNIYFIDSKGKEVTNNSIIVFCFKRIRIDYIKEFRQSCNFIKNYYIQQNNYINSNVFYALEMLARGRELRFMHTPLDKIIFSIDGLTSDHGQSSYWPIVSICSLTIIWWLKYHNTDYIIGIAFPIIDIIDNKDTIGNIENFGIKLLYILSKLFSAVLWWQLIRAIRKDIKR